MSALREALRDYLELRRSLGYKLQDAGLQLPRFIDFLETRGASHITTALAMEWAQQPTAVQPAEWARRLGGVRGLARCRHASDPLTEIPSPGPAAPPVHARQAVPVFGRGSAAVAGRRLEASDWQFYFIACCRC
jgi:hypothetical protein